MRSSWSRLSRQESGNPLFIPEAMDQVGNLFWAVGHHSAPGWSPFGVEDLSPYGQVAQPYKLLSPMLPQLAEWEAAGKVNGILVSTARRPDLFSWTAIRFRCQPVWDLAHQLPRQIQMRSLELALHPDPEQCRVTCDRSPLWSTPRPTNSCSVRMEIPSSRLIQARKGPCLLKGRRAL